MTRKYQQRRRAEQQEETRHRIIRAAVELHEAVGPARTTFSAIAERAGVQRNTLYRHFADERSLLQACSGLYMEENPLPDPAGWDDIADPAERARQGLRALYAYWEGNEAMTATILRDAEVHDVTREMADASMEQPLARIRDTLLRAWPRGGRRKRLAAAVTLAMDFHTWQSLVRQSGLSSEAAAELMAGTLVCAAQE